MQGWKLHVTTTINNAHEVLRRVLPVLVNARVAFKVVASSRELQQLNQGLGGLSQIGKFLTIYPTNDKEAVKLAIALDRATVGLEGPDIPSDRRLRPGSLVHFRYGGFHRRLMQTSAGELFPYIIGANGDLVPDQRGIHYTPPEGIDDPFLAAGAAAAVDQPSSLLGGRYFVARTVHRTARGL